MLEGGRVVFAGSESSVSLQDRGLSAVLRFAGACSRALVEWLPRGVREARKPVALDLAEFTGGDESFFGAVADLVKKRNTLVLLAPAAAHLGLLAKIGAGDKVPLLSSEGAIDGKGSLADALAHERMAFSEIALKFSVNPLWNRVDQEQTWLCALCGAEVADVRLPDPKRPGPVALLGVRRHLLDRCDAVRKGRMTALPASILDAFLTEINRRKGEAHTETKKKLSDRVESLQERVESMVELEQSVSQAQRRQFHLIPIDPRPDEVADIAVVYRPLQSVSGDFLDFYSLPDNRFGVSIGDVSGHGVEAAILMGMAKMALRIRSQSLGTVGEMMAHANRDLFQELRRDAFVTGFFGLIDRDLKRLSYVRAGHPPPLLRRAKGGPCEELGAGGLPFGVDDGKRFATGLDEQTVDLEPDDVLLLFTDGVIEAGPDTAQFGTERLRAALLAAPAAAPARAVLDSIVASLDAYLAGSPLNDDVTLVCLKIR